MSEDEHGRPNALRPLWAVAGQTGALRSGALDDAGRRQAVVEVGDAVEWSLRRFLRDAAEAPLPVRLRALAPDEIRSDEVLAELRQHDLISVELAASIHELFEARTRLIAGGALQPGDRPLAVRAADRLEVEVSLPHEESPSSRDPSPLDDTLVHAVPLPDHPPASRRWLGAAGALVLLLVLVFVALRMASPREDPEMARGISLFRSGAYSDAAAHFWRYSQDHPDDATPHLYLARIHRRMGRSDLAAPELREALRLAPDDAGVQSELGFLLLDSERYDVAIERFRAAIRLDADAAEPWIGLVRALEASGRRDAAERVLATSPERVRELFARRTGPAIPQP